MKLEHIVLDLDETLISALEVEEYHEYKDKLVNKKAPYHIFEDYYYIYERPGVQEFLDFLFKNYKVTVWTAASREYALYIIDNIILTKPERKLEYIFFSYHCKLSTKKYKNHKQMKQLWETFKLNEYNDDNVLIIDDKEELTKNQPQNVINCKPFVIIDNDADDDKDFDRIKKMIEKNNTDIDDLKYKPGYKDAEKARI